MRSTFISESKDYVNVADEVRIWVHFVNTYANMCEWEKGYWNTAEMQRAWF